MNIRYLRTGRFAGLCLLLALLFGACENPANGDDENPVTDPTAATRNAADQFYADHRAVLIKPADMLTLDDEAPVDTALDAYKGLRADVKKLLADEKAHLDILRIKLNEIKGAADDGVYYALTDVLAYLMEAPDNTADTPYTVAYRGTETMKRVYQILGAAGKYVSLDLSATGAREFYGETEAGVQYIVSLILPDTLTEIPGGTSAAPVFQQFGNLKSVSAAGLVTLGNYTFHGCTSLISVNLPQAVSIGQNAFYRCSGLTTLNLPQAVSIAQSAFYQCTSLTTLNLPRAVTIGSSAFYQCTGLTSITLPEAVTLNGSAFYQCIGLTTLSITALPKATIINQSAFFGCTSLTTANLPQAETIAVSAFLGCRNLTSVSLPLATFIGNTAFQGCIGLTTITLPKVASIGTSAFSGCTAITIINLPEAATIGATAFNGCTSLTTITLGATPPATIGTVVFSGAATTAKTITIKTRYPGLYTYAGTPWSDKVNMANSAAGNFWDNTAATRDNLTVALAAL